MRFQTPMSALGLPQTRAMRARDGAIAVKEAMLLRRRRVVVALGLAALFLCVVMTWRLVLRLPDPEAPRRAVPGAAEAQRQQRLQQENRLAEERLRAVQRRREPRGFRDDKQIVLLLTHFRDSEACAQTLVDARALAFRASRLHFRVFEELHLAQEQSCMQRFCELQPNDCQTLLRSRQLRAQRRDASGALGPTVARFMAEGLVERDGRFQDDDFYLSVEPSVVFTRHWDLQLLKQWHSVGNSMAILSVAPKAEALRGRSNNSMLVQCSARIQDKQQDTVVVFNAPEPIPRALFAPVLQPQYSELFHFGPLHALWAVRSDPYTPLISTGHEFARATRFWTRGFDFYAPNEDTLFARYKWQTPPLPSTLDETAQQQRVEQSNRRIRRLLELPVSRDDEPLEARESYAPGANRSMEAWRSFSGIDPRAAFDESTTNQFSICHAMARGQLHYVPY